MNANTITVEMTPFIWEDQRSWAENRAAETGETFEQATKGRKVLVTMTVESAWEFIDQIEFYADPYGPDIEPYMVSAYRAASKSLWRQAQNWPTLQELADLAEKGPEATQ